MRAPPPPRAAPPGVRLDVHRIWGHPMRHPGPAAHPAPVADETRRAALLERAARQRTELAAATGDIQTAWARHWRPSRLAFGVLLAIGGALALRAAPRHPGLRRAMMLGLWGPAARWLRRRLAR